MNLRLALAIALGVASVAPSAIAQETLQNTAFNLNGQTLVIGQSVADPALVARFIQDDPACDMACLAPLTVARDVVTVTEAEVIAFLADEVASGRGMLIDSRSPQDRLQGFVPASLNVPARLMSDDNPLLDDILRALGATGQSGAWQFDAVMPLVVYDAGPAQQDATRFITLLIQQGYPTPALRYYRGGMLNWSALGLTTEGNTQ